MADPSLEASLVPLADGVWTSTAPIRFLGLRLTGTMTGLRLGDGSLLLHSPVERTPERRAAVEALGGATHLYSPNLMHHLKIGDWQTVYPEARLHAPPGLAKKRPDLRIDRVHRSGAEPSFEGVVDELHVEGCRLDETVLYHRPSRTLLVADLLHNVGRPAHGWTSLYTRAMGFHDRIALSRALRWTAFPDKTAARRSLDLILELPFERIVVGHGAPITTGAKDALAAAYRWLRAGD